MSGTLSNGYWAIPLTVMPPCLPREDYVDEAWWIVEPVLKDTTPVWEYEPNSWGPSEVDQRVSPAGGWNNPVVAG